jgi:hypothetical protein
MRQPPLRAERALDAVSNIPPTLAKLWALADERSKAVGCAPAEAFECAGLLLDRQLSRRGYDSTPANALTFASTGGDGVHYSFVLRNGVAMDDAPIVMTVPMNAPTDNLIIGANLRDFIGVGSRLGFFPLEQLMYDPIGFLAAYAGKSDDYALEEEGRALVASITHAFGARPPADLDGHLASLDERFASWLEPGLKSGFFVIS